MYDIRPLLEKYIQGIATVEEQLALETFIDEAADEDILPVLDAVAVSMGREDSHPHAYWEELWQSIMLRAREMDMGKATRDAGVRHMRRHVVRKWLAAASVILLLGIGVLYWKFHLPGSIPITGSGKSMQNDAQPGRPGAILTLADGQKLTLDSLGNGTVAIQGGAKVSIRNGQLIYHTAAVNSPLLYNTISTPRGRQFQMMLSDGTHVWLNAASSITYPATFTGNERRIKVSGEAYFEVTKDKTKPFRVEIDSRSEVQVLGTSFNINSYLDEGTIRTTLLEGSIRVGSGGNSALLRPGQQAVEADHQQLMVRDDADLQQVVAWKNGYFNFDNADIKVVLRQLEKWYDIEVQYEGNIPPHPIYGKMQRDLLLSQVLDVLKKLGVRYKFENKRLTIMP